MKRLYLQLKIIFLILIYIPVALPAKSKVLELRETKDTYKLGKYLHILEDKKGELTFDDILKKNHAQKYITVNKDAPNMGFTFSTFWIKFTLSNQSQKNFLYYLVYGFPGLDSITLYQKLGGVWKKEVSGDHVPAAKKKLKHRYFPFEIYPKESSTYYLKIKNTAAMQIPLKIYTPEAYQDNRDQDMYLYSVFFGVLIIMAVYHGLIYFSTKMISYIYYSIFLSGVLSLVLAITGFGAYLLPNYIWFNNHGIVFGLMGAVLGVIIFLYEFLEIKNQAKYNIYLFRFSLFLTLVYGFCAFFVPFWIGIRVVIFSVGMPLGTAFWWGVNSFIQKHKSSKYVAYGFLSLIFGGFVKLGQGLGVLPTNFFIEYFIYIAICIQILFFSMGLADLISQLKQEALKQAFYVEQLNEALEQKVKDRTKQLSVSLESIELLINNMSQSVFAINSDGIIIEPVSHFSLNIFGEEVTGKSIWDTLYKELKPEDNDYATIQFGFSIIFGADDLQWLMVGDTFPVKYEIRDKEGKEKRLKTRMEPIYHNGLCDKIMFIIEDVTALEKLEADMKKQREKNDLKIEKLQSIVSNSKDSIINFFYESYQIIKDLEENSTDKRIVLRSVHTLKGISRLYGLNFMSTTIHSIEGGMISLFEQGAHKKNFAIEFKIKKELLKATLDQTLEVCKEIYGEIFDPEKPESSRKDDIIEVHRTILDDTFKEVSELIKTKNYNTILGTLGRLSNVNVKRMASDLQNIVFNTAKKLDKNVSLNVSGDDSYLPEKSIAILKESFIHLLTNCVDHGIDKDGDIDVTIKETFDFIKINVRDNGKGINEEAVLKKAIEKSILTEEEAEDLNSTDIKNLIFTPSFSTKKTTTETSGRGIGMDVVNKNIKKLGGNIVIEEGQTIGTSFMITLPHFEKKTG